ncbi:MAG: response regulator transcription factor [Deferribacteres bacterium]|nr:response regulator transcription factor [candidate division KSB1 bacterium]MCB9509218.1 response regulator transcription factor [Deferribacteres bacterium]
MPQTKILLVEDDPNLGFLLQENLELQNFAVHLCEDGDAGLQAFTQSEFDLCVLDVMLPKKDGFTLAKEIRRENSDMPIIFLTAKSLKEDRIEGFKAGCDDYVTKPFSLEELVLRIQAVLRRSLKTGRHESEQTRFTLGRYQFDHVQQTLTLDSESRKLTDKEADLLLLLCLHQNEVLDRQMALRKIWGEDNFFNARSMDVYVSKLRKYFADDNQIEIRNVHGRGFKMMVG